jgi:hypothetical protein
MLGKRIRREPDMQSDLLALTQAHRAAVWAEIALTLREAGEIRAAQTAERKVKKALRKAMIIEARYPPMTQKRHLINRH